MKAINYLNYFFVGFPILLISIGLITNEQSGDLTGYGLLFTILTGLFQVVFGIKMLIDEPSDKSLQYYIKGVVFFFLLWFVNGLILNYDFIYFILYTIPPILAVYFSTITYKKAQL